MKYIYPRRLVLDDRPIRLHGRAAGPFRGTLRLKVGETVLAERRIATLQERRFSLTLPASLLPRLAAAASSGPEPLVHATLE